MGIKWLLTLLSALLFSTLQAKDSKSVEDNPVINFGGVPSALVNGSVNVITGDYMDHSVDISIPGPEPFTFERFYISSDSDCGSLCHGWNRNHQGYIQQSVERIYSNPNVFKTYVGYTANVDSGLGVRMNYFCTAGKSNVKNSSYRIHSRLYETGLSNISGYEISGRTNHKCDFISMDEDHDFAVMTDGSGTAKVYQRYPDYALNVYIHKKTIKPNRLRYQYDHNENFNTIHATLKGSEDNVISTIHCDVPVGVHKDFKKNPHYNIYASNGRKVRYNFVRLHKDEGVKHWYLKSVEKDSGPNESYVYEKHKGRDGHKSVRVVQKNFPGNRYMMISYAHRVKKKSLEIPKFDCEDEDNDLDDDGDLEDNDDFEEEDDDENDECELEDGELICKNLKENNRYKVVCQRQPVGVDNRAFITYTFNYTYDKKKNYGLTDVRDAHKVKTLYEYSNNRLDAIYHYLDSTNLYSSERYCWGKLGTEQQGNLMSYALFGPCNASVYMLRTYSYDNRGNILTERFYGNLTGDGPGGVLMSNMKTPMDSGNEYDQKSYTYSDDGKNLCLTETHNNTVIAYGYHWQADLLEYKLVYVDGKIVERQYFDYDRNGVKILEICDDGSSTNYKEDLTSVTQRTITRITPSINPIGLPGEVSHYYLDLATGQEKLLKRIENTYSGYGYLIKEDTYDCNNNYAYSKEWEYDSMGNVLLSRNALGETTTYRYDANKNKIFEQGPRPDVHKEFVYDYSNRMVAEKEVYDNGTILSKQYRYDLVSNKRGETDIYGNETAYEYDGLKRLVKTTRPILFDVNGQATDQTHELELNIFNAIICKKDPGGQKTDIYTNARGKPLWIKYPDGTGENFRYNLDGTEREHTDKNGVTTRVEYNYQQKPTRKSVYSASGQYLFETVTTYNPYNILSETDAAGNLTTFDYDGAGRLICKTKGTLKTLFEYDTLGRVYKETNLLENNDCISTTKLYDLLDRVIEERVENGAGELQSLTLTSYDCQGNKIMISTYGQAGNSTLYQEFNAHNEVIKSTDAEGRVTLTHYRYDYVNDHGQRVGYREITDPMGNVTTIIKNAHGKDCKFIRKNAFDKVLQSYQLYFDSRENQVARVETIYNPDDSTRVLKTLFEYNSANNMTRCIEAYGTSDQKELLIEYNNYGQKSCVTKSDGVRILYEYDAFGRLSRYYSSAGDVDYTYEYDLLNKPIIVRDHVQNTITTKSYNENGHMVHESLANGISINFDYDPIGRQTAVYLPDGSGYTYDFSGLHLKRITRKDKWGEDIYNHQYLEYDLSGKVLSTQLAGAAGSAVYDYDLLGRIRRIEFKHWREVIAGFDDAGNMTDRTFVDIVGNSNDKFTYDDLYQLKSESGSTTHTYKNDSLYNRTSKDQQNYRLNNLNQVLCDGEASYQYDRNGCLISKSSPKGDVQYKFDSLGRMVKMSGGNQTAEYTYDETNRRLSKKVYRQSAGQNSLILSEKYVYQGKHEIGTTNQAGEITSLRLLGNGLGAEIGAAVALEIDGAVYVPLHDHKGNVITLVDAGTGDVVECYRYSAFGEEQIYDASANRLTDAITPWRFSSKRHDAETGYVYYGQRYYDPELGRWITPDPIGFGDGPNLYAYVRNNPLTNIDLWGEDTREATKSGRKKQESYFGDQFKQKDQRVKWDLNFESRLGGPHSKHYLETAETINVPTQPNKGVGLANGIMNTFEDAKASAKHISRLGGGVPVYGVYNATHGIINDLLECFFGLNFFRGTTPVKLLHRQWDEFFATNGPDACFLQFCHSQGAIHVRNALLSYPEELRKRIIVVAIAPAAYISPDICKSVDHYVSSRDFIPYFDVRGRAECKDTIHYIKAHDDAGIWDHSFNSPTYEQAIKNHIRDYMRS